MIPIVTEFILKNGIECIMLLLVLIIDKKIIINKNKIMDVFATYVLKVVLAIISLYHVSFNILITMISYILSIGVIIICSNNKIEGYVSYTKYIIISGLFRFIFLFLGNFSITFPFARYKWFYYLSYLASILFYYIISKITKQEINKLEIIINTILLVISLMISYVSSLYYIGYLESFIIQCSLIIIMVVVNRKKIICM